VDTHQGYQRAGVDHIKSSTDPRDSIRCNQAAGQPHRYDEPMVQIGRGNQTRNENQGTGEAAYHPVGNSTVPAVPCNARSHSSDLRSLDQPSESPSR
jgi:hypothetical protein